MFPRALIWVGVAIAIISVGLEIYENHVGWSSLPVRDARFATRITAVGFVCAALCLRARSRGRNRKLMLTGLLAAIALVLLTVITFIWRLGVESFVSIYPWYVEQSIEQTLEIVLLGAGYVAAVSLMPLDHPIFRRISRWVPTLAIVCMLLACTRVIAPDFAENIADWPGLDEWLLLRILLVLIAALALLTITIGGRAIYEWSVRRQEAHRASEDAVIELTCPKCRTRQTMRGRKQSCSNCNLSIELRLTEPRCQCGYLLLYVRSGVCPECGKPIASAASGENPNEQCES